MILTDEEAAWAQGEAGEAMAMATRILADMGRILGADRLIPIASAHIDGCLYHGDSGVRFAERLVQGGGKVRVPTTLNVGALDLRKPDTIHLPPHQHAMARHLMEAYRDMGCQQTWTCAPYQVGHRPGLGQDVGWAESNAVVFVNSVLGARTNRYGDFLDICAALTGRVPRYGLHLPENRYAKIVVDTSQLSDTLKQNPALYPVLGAWLGRAVNSEIAVFKGLPADLSEDCLKALGAADASMGAVALFHCVGITPEAPTLEAALGTNTPETIMLTPEMLATARDRLSTTQEERLDVVSLGSPHYSLAEIDQFEKWRAGRKLKLPVYICTNRFVSDILSARGQAEEMQKAGVHLITDTCVVVTAILPSLDNGVQMTDSGKFAHYTPANTGYAVVYGSAKECVESAVQGRVVRYAEDWK